jgi:rubrerythrin
VELGTFGAILTFGLELEKQAASFYANIVDPELEALFNDLAMKVQKRIKRLERIRREGVAEMILESIHGFESEAFNIELPPVETRSRHIQQAIQLEDTRCRYYLSAADRLPLREVARHFTRMAKENETNTSKLEDVLTRSDV